MSGFSVGAWRSEVHSDSSELQDFGLMRILKQKSSFIYLFIMFIIDVVFNTK